MFEFYWNQQEGCRQVKSCIKQSKKNSNFLLDSNRTKLKIWQVTSN